MKKIPKSETFIVFFLIEIIPFLFSIPTEQRKEGDLGCIYSTLSLESPERVDCRALSFGDVSFQFHSPFHPQCQDLSFEERAFLRTDDYGKNVNCFAVFVRFGALWIRDGAWAGWRPPRGGHTRGGWPFSRAFACLSRWTIPEGKG